MRRLAEAGDIAVVALVPALLDRLQAAEARIRTLEKAVKSVAENRSGKVAIVRAILGVGHGNAKITPAQVDEIKRDVRSLRTIAKHYDVHFSTISKIKAGKRSSPKL